MVWLLREAGLLLPCSGVQWSAVTAGCQEPGEPSLERLELVPARQLAKTTGEPAGELAVMQAVSSIMKVTKKPGRRSQRTET